jgi:UDP-N-acetylmuramoyl-L-alanyl-D-glutamate--2,6-diaminopimelate ligase
MLLSKWLQTEIAIPTSVDTLIKGITQDSRRVTAGFAFVSLPGKEQTAHQLDAIQRGASVIVIESETENKIEVINQIVYVHVKNLHEKIGDLAACFYDYPAKQLRIMGVTGTNGKTSCSQFIAQLLEANGVRCAIIGTLGCGFYGQLTDTGFTTPDVITLQGILRQFVDEGAKAVAMEVSSHSIHQDRIHGIEFEMGLFTNLTQDHLDYHGDMETYANVKYSFLAGAQTKHVIINADDEYGAAWIKTLIGHKPVYAYTLHESKNSPHVPTAYVDQLTLTADGIKAMTHTPWGEGWMEAPVVGQFNVSNILLSVMAVCAFGIPLSAVLEALAAIKPVPGRMQRVAAPSKPLCVVDYAHTPDALDKALSALKGHMRGKLVCVFGCGGDRDQSKRPLMAAVAEQWADKVIVTSDNPRHEKPEAIAEAIMQGFLHRDQVLVELDRSKAIEKSIQWATKDDCILIAGKGAEQYQQIGDLKIPFDDVKKVMEIFNAALVK